MKSRKRSLAAKKAWRSRRRKKSVRRANPKKRVYRKRAKNPSKSRKRSLAGKKAWRTRRRRKNPVVKANPKRRRRRRNTWFKQPIRHRRASKRGWYKRKRGGIRRSRSGSKYRYRTSRGAIYKRPKKVAGRYRRWRNPKHNIRTRNPGAMDIVLPVLTALGGLVGAGLLMKHIPTSITSKIPSVAGINLAVLIPGVAGVAAMTLLTKKMPKQSKMIYGLGFGLILASAMSVYNSMLAPKLNLPAAGALAMATTPSAAKVAALAEADAAAKAAAADPSNSGLAAVAQQKAAAAAAMSGYTIQPFSGYVPSSQNGYVRSMGQLEDRVPGQWRSMGEAVEYRGAKPAGLIGPSRKALDYAPLSVKPYGLGLPREERRYDDFAFAGVYNESVYE